MMPFSPHFLPLVLVPFLFAKAGFPFSATCTAAESSTNIAAAASTNAPRVVPKIVEAAEKGDPAAQTQVGNSFALGDRDLRDPEEACKWYRRAAEQGFAPAQVLLGHFLLRGIGVKQDETAAWLWWRKAADQNHTFALYMAGRASEEGVGPFKKDDAEAGQWYRKSADYGYALAQHHLGRLCAEGRGMPRDDIEALKWFELVDLHKSAFSHQLALIEANNKARLQLIERMSAKDDAEARRRAAAFVPKTPSTNDYRVTYWDSFPSMFRDGRIETIPVPIMPRTGTMGPISVSFMGRTQVIDTASFPFIGRTGTVETIFVTNLGLTGTIQTISSGFSPNPAPAPPVSRNAAQMLIEVPVRIEGNRPQVWVKVNGSKPLNFLFDSGATESFIRDKAAAKLKLKPTVTYKNGDETASAVEGTTLTLGGASFSPRRLTIHSFKPFRFLEPFNDGILGADFLQSFVVELDYRKGTMKLRDPNYYKYTGPGDYLLIRQEHGRPSIDARITDGNGKPVTARLLIDTGAGDSLYLEKSFSDAHALKESLSRTLSGKATGFTGRTPVRRGELEGLQIGHYFIDRPHTTFFDDAEGKRTISGLIGGGILSRFTVIFHYGRQQLILIPNGTFPQPQVRPDSASEMMK